MLQGDHPAFYDRLPVLPSMCPLCLSDLIPRTFESARIWDLDFLSDVPGPIHRCVCGYISIVEKCIVYSVAEYRRYKGKRD